MIRNILRSLPATATPPNSGVQRQLKAELAWGKSTRTCHLRRCVESHGIMTKLKKKWLEFVLFGTALAAIPTLAAIPAQASLCGKPAADGDYDQLDQGFHALYDLDFTGGESTFMAWET